VELGITILVGFSLPLLFRPLLFRAVINNSEEATQPRKAFIADFALCLVAGLLISVINTLRFNIPPVSLGSMLIGTTIAGFFIGIDSSLAQEKKVILRAMTSDALSPLPRKLFPMTRKFTLVAITTSVFFALVLIMVFVRDVEWLSRTAQDQQSIHAAQLSVIYEIFFIMAVLMVLIANLIFSYSANLKLLFNNETKILEQVSRGDLTAKVPVATYDEFGVIAGHTNEMIDGLRHRFELVNSLKLAEEVQQNLLPDQSPSVEGLDISGISLYCDQTGGDYYDYFQLPGGKLGIVVADACGHGVGAAMLMTSVRAFLTSAIEQYQDPARLVQGVNSFITRDCSKTGRFTSMFFLEIDTLSRGLKWVRAGHEPATLFRAADQSFTQLNAGGLVLGIDDSHTFTQHQTAPLENDDILLIGTDGISETRNSEGEMFGQERLEQLIADWSKAHSSHIIKALVEEVNQFRGKHEQEDDITLVVIKSV
jgi:sigma-B regulation protein RsbU (phosphoserine phosphatase)